MKDKLHQLFGYLNYQKNSKTKYYLHSPYVYQFYLHVLEGAVPAIVQDIETHRKQLTHDPTLVAMTDYGAQPSTIPRPLADLAIHASIPYHYGIVLHRLVAYLQPRLVIELGTCLGYSTAYLATAKPDALVLTIEGSESLTPYSERLFKAFDLRNIHAHTGEFGQVLPELLRGCETIDMAYIDGHHRYAPTIAYFNMLLPLVHAGTVLVFDDIHWSVEMSRAWQEIQAHPRVRLTLDIYRMGFVFFMDDKLSKEDFVLRY
jgi:predicted O-methyltransferase YrrM